MMKVIDTEAKEEFEIPKAYVTLFDTDDVIRTSDGITPPIHEF